MHTYRNLDSRPSFERSKVGSNGAFMMNATDSSVNKMMGHEMYTHAASDLDSANNLSRKNFFSTKMIDTLKDQNAIKLHGGRIVYGHVYNHNDHTHIHGHVHQNNSDNCQLDLKVGTETGSNISVVPTHQQQSAQHDSGLHDFDGFGKFQPQLVTICCDQVHGEATDNVVKQPSTSQSGSHEHDTVNTGTSHHHLHQCSTEELDLMNSCFDFDFCDNVECKDFVCDEYIHEHGREAQVDLGQNDRGQKANLFNMDAFDKLSRDLNADLMDFKCPLFLGNNHSYDSQHHSHLHAHDKLIKSVDSYSPSSDHIVSGMSSTELSSLPNNEKENKQQKYEFVHDRFILNPLTNELKCVSCQDECDNETESDELAALGTVEKRVNLDIGSSKVTKNKKRTSTCKWSNCKSSVDFNFLKDHLLENHLKVGSSESVNSCAWQGCDFHSLASDSLFTHVNERHLLDSVLTMNDDFNGIFIDDKVKQEESDSDEILMCQWIHDGGSCNKIFANTSDLSEHVVSDHIGSRKSSYVCCWKDCDRHGRVFNQRQKIIRHMHVHTKHRPFKCSVCGHCFPVDSMLEQHMRVHSGEKPFECKVCGKRFATSSSLSIHHRIHTGEKPMVCKYPGCNKRFSESSNLAKHMKTHEKRFKCAMCPRSFDKISQLESHLSKHANQ